MRGSTYLDLHFYSLYKPSSRLVSSLVSSELLAPHPAVRSTILLICRQAPVGFSLVIQGFPVVLSSADFCCFYRIWLMLVNVFFFFFWQSFKWDMQKMKYHYFKVRFGYFSRWKHLQHDSLKFENPTVIYIFAVSGYNKWCNYFKTTGLWSSES